MGLIDINRANFRFNFLPDTAPSGMYNIIFRNSNAIVSNNIIGTSGMNVKANFAIMDNSNIYCTNNKISGFIANIQGNSKLSEFNNIKEYLENPLNISIKCNSFFNFPSKLVSGNLSNINTGTSGFITPVDTEFTGNSIWSRYLINDGINYKFSDVSQNTIFWNEREIIVNFSETITLTFVNRHLSRIPKNLNGRTLYINFSDVIKNPPIKISNFFNGKVIVSRKTG